MVSPQNTTQNSLFLVERRREPRVTQPGSVNVTVAASDAAVTFPAAVVDTSDGGMCIRHWRKELAIGDEVQVSPASTDAQGDAFTAVVAWNWTVGPVVMSGLEKRQLQEQARGTLTAHNPRTSKIGSFFWASLTILIFLIGWYFIKVS